MHPKLMDWEGERVPKINEIWMLACINNSLKNKWLRRPKFKKITKKTIPKTMYFSHAFFYRFRRGLRRVLGGFWESFGRPLAFLGALSSLFFQGLFAKRAQEGPRGGQEVSWARFGRVWSGLGKGLGSPNNQKLKIFGIFLDVLFETLILVDFDSSFDNFDGGDGESKPVIGVCHGEEDRKASDICV